MEKNEYTIKAFEILGYIIGVVLAGALIYIAGPILTVIGLFVALVTVIRKVIDFFFQKDVGASTFLEGLVKIAHAFGSIAENVIGALNPITQITKLIEALGTTFSPIITGITGMFTALTNPDAAQNVMKIGEAIAAIPTRKNLEFVASMGAAATAATAAVAAPSASAAAAAAANRREERLNPQTVNQGPENITIELMVDRDKLATIVHKINGKSSGNAIAGRPN
jgi:hypothetical protein